MFDVRLSLEGCMITIKTIQKLMPPTVLFLLFACDRKVSSPGPDFSVRVTDHQGQPLEGAYIEGGMDWDYFRVVTDSRGKAVIPSHALYKSVTIYKNDLFSLRMPAMKPGEYQLMPTPNILYKIGEIEGDALIFDPHTIITVTYQGEYRVYDYGNDNLWELTLFELPHQVKTFKLRGDTLWYSTHENGIFAYSLADPYNPIQLFHLEISGYIKSFALKDSLVAVARSNYDFGYITLFSYSPDGSVNEFDQVDSVWAERMVIRSDYLIAHREYSPHLKVFDLADPNHIQQVYSNTFDGYRKPIFHNDTLFLSSIAGNDTTGIHILRAVDFTDPANPSDLFALNATGWIENIIDDSTAIGRYYYHYEALCVFRRNLLGDFETIAIVSELGYREHRGCKPPYFIIGERLWKLAERD